MIFPLVIAARFLRSGKGQTILITLGIAIGVSVQIFIGLLIQGLQSSLIDKTIGSSPHITITSTEDNRLIQGWESYMDVIRSADSRISNISAAADGAAFVKTANKNEPVLLRSLQLDKANAIYKIKESLYEGNMPDKANQILMGKELKNILGVKKGDRVKLFTPAGKTVELEITGFYDLKVTAVNKSWLISNLKSSQKAFGFGTSITSIEMQVKEVFKADEIAVNISNALAGARVKVEDWKTQNQQLLSGLNGQSVSSYMIQVFVLIAVILGIASVLAISVIQKSRQIGILKAMGIKDRTARLIFLYQGLILGLIGSLAGIALGLGLCIMFTKFALNPDGTPVVPLYINYPFIGLSGGIALISAMTASLIPARKSAKLNPIEVIRNG